jgi:hypothetical protein
VLCNIKQVLCNFKGILRSVGKMQVEPTMLLAYLGGMYRVRKT